MSVKLQFDDESIVSSQSTLKESLLQIKAMTNELLTSKLNNTYLLLAIKYNDKSCKAVD